MLVKVPIEVDITYVNKTWFSFKNLHRVNHYVIGFFQRGYLDKPPKCIIEVLDENNPQAIKNLFLKCIAPDTFLYAEEGILPECVREIYNVHEFKNNEVNKEVHINNLKNAWKDLKREIKTVHFHVSKKYLQGYCNEVAWRVNNKHLTTMERFNLLLQGSGIQRTKFKDLKTPNKNLVK